MLHGYLVYMILQSKDFSTEFPAIFYTVNPRGNCNCKLCSAQFRVEMRSVWEAVQPGTFAYNTGCIFNAREGLIGSIRHGSLTYRNWGWEQSFPMKVELIYFCRKTPRKSTSQFALELESTLLACALLLALKCTTRFWITLQRISDRLTIGSIIVSLNQY